MVLDDSYYESFSRKGEKCLEELIRPVGDLLVPLFFLMGLKVDLRAFGRPEWLTFALTLTVAAIIGKQICSLGVVEKGINRLAVGVGMVPRGEVGLIFAGIGSSLMLPNADGINEPVIHQCGDLQCGRIHGYIYNITDAPRLKWAMENNVQDLSQKRA
jgi:Kef-type K+ transport system membrane component KefB